MKHEGQTVSRFSLKRPGVDSGKVSFALPDILDSELLRVAIAAHVPGERFKQQDHAWLETGCFYLSCFHISKKSKVNLSVNGSG